MSAPEGPAFGKKYEITPPDKMWEVIQVEKLLAAEKDVRRLGEIAHEGYERSRDFFFSKTHAAWRHADAEIRAILLLFARPVFDDFDVKKKFKRRSDKRRKEIEHQQSRFGKLRQERLHARNLVMRAEAIEQEENKTRQIDTASAIIRKT